MSRDARHLLLLLFVIAVVASAGCGSLENATGPTAPLVPAVRNLPPAPASDNAYALSFSGISSRVDIPYSPSYKTPKFTVELWVYVSSVQSSFTPLIASSNTNEWNTADGYSVKFESNRLYLRAAKASNLAAGYYTPLAPPTQKWTHIAGTYDGVFARVYVDGQLLLETKDERPIWYGNRGLVFGSGYHSLFGGQAHFSGMMDEIRIWDHVRSAEEIRFAMEGELTGKESGLVGYWNFENREPGRVLDASPSGNHGSTTGLLTYVSTTPF